MYTKSISIFKKIVYKRAILCQLVIFLAAALWVIWLIYHARHMPHPSENNLLAIYSTETNDNLKRQIMEAIGQAKHSILLSTYTFGDEDLQSALQQKIDEGVKVEIRYDPSTKETLPLHCTLKEMKVSGLFHDKILVLDESKIWISSANFTSHSLLLDHNLCIALYSPPLARAIYERRYEEILLDGIHISYLPLPQEKQRAKQLVISLLKQCKQSIKGSLFVLTHPDITAALQEAHARGVDIHLTLDRRMLLGAGKRAAQKLIATGIPLAWRGSKNSIFHHKWLLLDNDTLIAGSTNLTKGGFEKNGECLIVLSSLKKKEITKIQRMLTSNCCTAGKVDGLFFE